MDMIPGIDPRIDIAFKKLFGSQASPDLTISLINAVLCPPPGQQLTEIELLNPYNEKMTLDDKLSILDIKARDDQGRLFNVEMQMVAGPSLQRRFLYYWARLYSQQLVVGEDYGQLRPTISICFINGSLFPNRTAHHTLFRLLDDDAHCMTNQIEIHLIELVKFNLGLNDLVTPLDFWLYFLKNGVELDADALPAPLDASKIRQAMGVLKMFSQDEMERELYEGRLKAKRDYQTFVADRERVQQQLADAKQQLAETEQQREQARRAAKQAIVERVLLCQRLLGRGVSDSRQLEDRDMQALRELANRLERELMPPGE